MEIPRNPMNAAKARGFEPYNNSQHLNNANIHQAPKAPHQNQPCSVDTRNKLLVRYHLILPYQVDHNTGTNQAIIGPQQFQVGSCITARRRIGRTQRGQDPLSYKIGSLTFHTFRAMDPHNGCICPPSQFRKCCRRPCNRVMDMRRENFMSSHKLINMPEELRRKMIGHKDPVDVLICRALKYNAKYITEITEQNPQHIFEEMKRIDDIVRMMEKTRV